MEEHQVVPDVLDKVPANVLEVRYSDLVVDLGTVLTPTQVQNPPTYLKWAAEEGGLYTIVMTDPDAPSRQDPRVREFHHWMMVNVPETDVSKGDTWSEYIGSGPPKGTGLHRYVLIVYKQQGRIVPTEDKRKKSTANRTSWRTRDFAKANALGDPVAANFYQAEYDDYVPKLHKELASNITQ
ncbi:protein D3-like [Anneissia japonica]|uniref:protein D3-like n=1 Tax=Anneissia japonica TaxID=1529436 RepID=UPI001425B9D9|nr:protein D3-like [Anneissia japonica]XP_033102662.1 protein D3-like [Anneissia japonica]